ncbi:MAG TPA: hypothetical protein VN868_07525 [Terriglobales bacterium]|jgi:hypothetical protein|nr:hypothetical protein [Terriglobales bacterium]
MTSMFLAEVDGDQVNWATAPDAPTPSREQSRAGALALGVGHSWGEQFAAARLSRVGSVSALASIEDKCQNEGRAAGEIMALHLK